MKYRALGISRLVKETGATASGWVIRTYDEDGPCRITLDVEPADLEQWLQLIKKENEDG